MKKISVCLSVLVLLLFMGGFIFGCSDDSAADEDESTTPNEEALEEDDQVAPEEDEFSSDEESRSPSDQVYSDDPDDENGLNSTVYSKDTVTTERDQQVSGEVNLADGASIMIGTEPANGSASVESRGSWKYIPESDFIGEDAFTLVFDREDGREEIKTVQVRIDGVGDEDEQDEAEHDEEEQEEEQEEQDEDDETLPGAGGGMAIASLVALWLFILATFSLRKGVSTK